jgi:hypothetical protein
MRTCGLPSRLLSVLTCAAALLAARPAVSEEPAAKAVTPDEARAIAERFVRENGYTQEPATLPLEQLVPESLEWSADRAEWLKARAGTLEPTADSASCSDTGCTVLFRYRGVTDVFRAVVIDASGGQVRIIHQDVLSQPLETPDEPAAP